MPKARNTSAPLDPVREQVIKLLNGGQAHATFDQAVEGFPAERAGERPPGLPHTFWQLLEHMRIAQNDILQFSKSGEYDSPAWPEGYWPDSAAPENRERFEEAIASFRRDLAEFEKIIRNPDEDLNRPFPWGTGQTLLREALLIADHNAYHIGQLVLVRRALGEWDG
jgi:uncharacterized damage-inducible protein DinB